MVALTEILPKAKSSVNSNYDHSNDPWFKSRYSAAEAESSEAPKAVKSVPPYLKRAGFKPSKPEDFGDGGAFPEIHYAQYPLGMGRSTNQKPGGGKTLPLTVDDQGNLRYDAIVKQNENSKKIVYSQHTDLIPIFAKDSSKEDEMDVDEKQKEIDETTQETKAALEKIVNVRLSAAQPKNVPKQSSDSKFIKYKPSQQSTAFNSGAKERIIRMVETPVDPLEPPKFKHKRVPKASGSPPVPVMHSPPRPVTVKDQQDWKIPPCISNWKNPKGYTIPLDKRLAADGRGLQEVQINDNFAKLSEALYVAEQKAREAVAMRTKVQKEMMMKEKEKKEMDLRMLAQKARNERSGAAPAPPVPSSDRGVPRDVDMGVDYDDAARDFPKESREEREKRVEREKIREERRRERERERRLEAKDAAMGKKSKITRDRDRDISEKVALGMASTGGKAGEVMYDQRLFNQEKGMDSGFATDDAYNIYDKGLFASSTQSALSTLYKPKKDVDDEMYGGADEQLEKLMKTERFKADRGFSGTSERSGPRDRPVEFDRDQQPAEEDPFGLDQFMTKVKTGKRAMDKIGTGGTLKASAGSMRDGFESSGRSRIAFEKGR
ncbi:hypothetical protein M569_14669 [Genlisea aurea]|uniref:SKI-interacting protein SKIP SNW domain-containing protein n=1 Tax=Genlisea aurea TaxID=192259 RepID=S8C0F9_9LAMI|nr:hypothetical protein M569_14669 [Genlisea aurea]